MLIIGCICDSIKLDLKVHTKENVRRILMDNIKKRYEELKKIIAYHANKYYNDDEPEISDFEYDMLMVGFPSPKTRWKRLPMQIMRLR